MIHLEDVLKMFCFQKRHVFKMSSKCLQDIFKTSWNCLEDIFKTLLQDVLKTSEQGALKTSWSCLVNVLKTSRRRMTKTNIVVLIKRYWGHLEDAFWRCMTKVNLLVFWRRRRWTSSRPLQDVSTKQVFAGQKLMKLINMLMIKNIIKLEIIATIQVNIEVVHI